MDAQRVQRADAADAQEQLLADPDPGVAAVEPGGQRRGPISLFSGTLESSSRSVGPPDLDPPDPRAEDARVRSRSRPCSGVPSGPCTGSIGSSSGSVFR